MMLSESITSNKIGNTVINKTKSVIPPQFTGSNVLSYTSDKEEVFAEIILENSMLDYLRQLSVFFHLANWSGIFN